MIDKALNFLLDEINGFLGRRFQSSEELAVLSSLANPDGTIPLNIENKLVLTLANVEREGAAGASGESRLVGPRPRVSPPLHLNLYLLVAANFGNNYRESIKFLSQAVAFFQASPVFTPERSSAFPREMERLTVDLMNMDLAFLYNLWSALGAKYLPSVVYKVRMLTVQEAWMTDLVPGVAGTDTKVGSG